MIKLSLVLFLISITIPQISANNRSENDHIPIQTPSLFFEQNEFPNEPFSEQDFTRQTVDDFLDLMWEDIPPSIQKIILCFGGVGMIILAAPILGDFHEYLGL